MKVLEVIQRSTEFLSRKGVDAPRLQAELLLADVLELPRMELYLNFERMLTEAELNACRELVKRRAAREPLQQIIGSTSFCGLEISLNRHVLVPRPETELLAELGWEFLKLLNPQTSIAFEFGTGSGCIAIALAVKSPNSRIHAVDVSAEALVLAQANAARHAVADRITFIRSNGLEQLVATPEATEMRFALVIGNPPYIPSGEIDTLQPEVRDYEPRHALDGGIDGLDFYHLLAAESPRMLASGGRIMLEFGDGQAEAVQEIFRAQNWIVERTVEDYTRRPRILVARLS